MAENRIPRESQTRASTARKKAWENPELLPNPEPKEGYSYRWIRVAINGEHDPRNISMKLREGWEPVLASEHPEILQLGGPENPRFADNVVIGGLMLCKAPVEMTQARDASFQQVADNQMRGVDNDLLREQDPRMPVFNTRSTKVSRFGTGN